MHDAASKYKVNQHWQYDWHYLQIRSYVKVQLISINSIFVSRKYLLSPANDNDCVDYETYIAISLLRQNSLKVCHYTESNLVQLFVLENLRIKLSESSTVKL